MMPVRPLTILFCLFICSATAQDVNRLRAFDEKINQAKSDAEKIDALTDLAEYYSVYNLEPQADSILQKALFIAEVSSDKELVLKILFNNRATSLSSWSNKERFERNSGFIQKGLQYAQDQKNDDYAGLAYIRLAGLFRKRHLLTEALQQATEAVTTLANTKDDSLRCVLYSELGDIYMANTDAVRAFKNYNTAFDIAYKQKNVHLQSEIYIRFCELYKSFGDSATAKKYLLQGLELNTKENYLQGQFLDYIGLARITNERAYIEKAAVLAQALNSDRFKLAANRLLYYWYMVEGKNSEQTFHFLYSNPGLVQYFKNSGEANFNWEIGNVYRYSAKYDSALHYYLLAEGQFASGAGNQLSNNQSIAETYLEYHDSINAKKYFEKAFILCRQMNKLNSVPAICETLEMLCAQKNDFRSAYYYSVQVDSANKILQANASKDKVVLLQVDQENKKRETDLAEINQHKQRKYNLQIMAITLVLTVIFAVMLFVGMFAVSKTAIKMLGYFAFISLFEFIILVLDHPIITFTHGEPLKIWGIKILLIAILVPCQHFLEHRLIHFLQSRKLLEARLSFSIKHLLRRVKKPAPVADAGTSLGNKIDDIEEDTAVL